MTPPLDRFEWERLIRELPFPMPVKCVAYALGTYVNGDGTNAHPGTERLIRATGSSRATVTRSLSVLQSAGFIRQVQKANSAGSKKGNSCVWELSVPDTMPLPNLWITCA